jgi:GNAT superfamily N-acetyltransferase
MPAIRHVEPGDLDALLVRYRHLNPEMPALPRARAECIWLETLARPGLTVLVAPADGRLVATCTLVTAPNLMRGGAPHAFLENVVTDTDYRRQGYGRAIVTAAVNATWALGAYQVMLLTRHQNAPAHALYHACGFCLDHKAGLVIRRPTGAHRSPLA